MPAMLSNTQTSHDNLPGMTTLYDSDAFIVVHMHGLPAAEKNAEDEAASGRISSRSKYG